MSESNEKLIALDKNGAKVLSPKILEKLKKKELSPSLVTAMEGCAARWVADTYVMRDIVPEEPDNAARRGSLFHQIMETLFALPAEERTTAKMKEIVSSTLRSEEYKDLASNRDVISWIRSAVNGYYSMGGKPEAVEIATMSEGKNGIEHFVRGKIGNTSRHILGFVDLIVNDTLRNDNSIIITDWKSGKTIKQYKPGEKYEKGLAEQRQQIIYAELLRQEDRKISGARLIFPVAQGVVNVDLGDEELRNRVIADVEKADARLTELIESNHYPYTPGVLCAWCPLAKICPSAKIIPAEKMREAFSQQPGIEILEKGIDFSGLED